VGLFGRQPRDSTVETIAAAEVKARAEVLLDQMTSNLTELRELILGGRAADDRSDQRDQP
jgi:hypothetical protein